MSIRVLHIVPDLEFGGLQRLVCDLSPRDDDQLDVQVLNLGPDGPLTSHLSESVSVHGSPAMSRASMIFPRALSRFLRKLSPDVVHIHSGVWYKSALAARIAGVPRVIYTEHGRAGDTLATRGLASIAAHNTDRIVAVSKSVAEYLRAKLGVPVHKLALIQNGVDTSRFRPAPRPPGLAESLGIPEGAFVVGSVGRLDPVKRYDLLIRAFGEFLNGARTYDPFLIIVGDGSERSELGTLVEREGIADRVVLAGAQADVAGFYNLFDVFALTSASEGTPLALLESMASGTPPVAARVGGVPEVLDGELTDLSVEPGEVGPLVARLRRLAEDAAYRRRIGDQARSRVQTRYSLPRMVRAYHSLYAEGSEGRGPEGLVLAAQAGAGSV